MLFRDDLVALLHGFLDSGLVFVGRVVGYGVEIVVCEESVYYLSIVVFVYDDSGFTFIS